MRLGIIFSLLRVVSNLIDYLISGLVSGNQLIKWFIRSLVPEMSRNVSRSILKVCLINLSRSSSDRSNHVPSCGRVNSSKGSDGPSDFLRRSRDGNGLEYEIVKFCEYVQRYYAVKIKYGLSLISNDKKGFR